MMILVVIASLARVQCDFSNNESNANSIPLVETLRRQLMQDNYDYVRESAEEDAPTPPSTDYDKHNTTEYISNYDDHEANDERQMQTNNVLVPRARDEVLDGLTNDEHAVSNKDLLYYVNDDRLRTGKTDGNDVDDYSEVSLDNDQAKSSTIKYKALKVKPSHPNRRSLTSRRFIQEEAEDGVAIINLDDGPFPEFRLPSSRRQYMQDEDAGTEELVPPVNGDDVVLENVANIEGVVTLGQ